MIETLGRYKILSILGQGAMGVVYKAVDPMIDRSVAIKTINLALNPDELVEYEARFQQEIKAAGRLNHPSIVTIFDVGKNESVAYMAMELLDGSELKDLLAAGQRPTVTEVVDWIGQIAGALASAHEAGIVHRDVKPSNIMIVKGGLAKITDFGIARMTASAVKTMTGMILGSPRYMSPEQVIGREVDQRTDIFSLGVVLYESLTGSPPFEADNLNAIMYATVNHAQQPASQSNPDVPTMLDLIVAKALAKSVEERYQSMREFAADLNEVKRQFAAALPNATMVAQFAPSAPKPVSLAALGLSAAELGALPQVAPPSARNPLDRKPTDAAPLPLNREFDSFDATVKLASITSQVADFGAYISDAQKVRALNAMVDARKSGKPTPDPLPAKDVGSDSTDAGGQLSDKQAGSAASDTKHKRPRSGQTTPTASEQRAIRMLRVAIAVLSASAIGLLFSLVLR